MESKNYEFISSDNIETYQDTQNDIFDNLAQSIIEQKSDLIKQDNDDLENLELTSQDIDRLEIPKIKLYLTNYLKMTLQDPILNINLKKQLKQLTIQEVEQLSNPKEYKYLYLQGKNLSYQIDVALKNFSNIKNINLSYNKISDLKCLGKLITLENLNVSHNMIDDIQPIQELFDLKTFNLGYNLISKYEQMNFLKDNKNLRSLIIWENPISQNDTYFQNILQRISQITHLNYIQVKSGNQQIVNSNAECELTEDMIYENTKFSQSTNIKKQINWQQSIEILDLSYQKIVSIKNGLQFMVNIRNLNLSYNLIQKIENLENCKLLEELNFENNQITYLQGIQNLAYLKRLELGFNKLTSLQGLEKLQNLMQLSVEDNQITTLQDFPKLKNLMELYLANNKLSTTREINFITQLSKLIILDLSGNPLSKDPNYRVYTLYNLKKLKVLDGQSIEAVELMTAKELFTGRLTEEILLQRLDGLTPEAVIELDLSNCKLRDFEDIFNKNYYPNLVELNLSHNLFQLTSMIGDLPSLEILLLHQNKLQTLAYPTDVSQIKGLNGAQNVEILDISCNQLKDFNGFQFCKLNKLKILKVDHNEITKIDNIDNFVQLRELDVNSNKIKQFEPNSFASVNSLKCLKIEDNGLKFFSNIKNLYKLQHLFANNNRFVDFPDIENLLDLQNLRELELQNSPLSRKVSYRMQMIKKFTNIIYLDGKEITFEEKERLDLLQMQDQAPQNQEIKQINQNIFMNIANQGQPNSKVPVKLTAMNFEGLFAINKIQNENKK